MPQYAWPLRDPLTAKAGGIFVNALTWSVRTSDLCTAASLFTLLPLNSVSRLRWIPARADNRSSFAMVSFVFTSQTFVRPITAAAMLGVGAAMCGCAGLSDTIAPAFANPAQYDLYSCAQIEAERKDLAKKTIEIQRLMAKAETGAAGLLVVELPYRNDYLSLRGQAALAEDAWRRNRCVENLPAEPTGGVKPPSSAAPVPQSGGARRRS